MIHGRYSTYVNQKCRCPECRAANRDYCNAARQRRYASMAAGTSSAPHGSASTYQGWGCRCIPCMMAWATVVRQRARRVS